MISQIYCDRGCKYEDHQGFCILYYRKINFIPPEDATCQIKICYPKQTPRYFYSYRVAKERFKEYGFL